MNQKTHDILARHAEDLDRINDQRRLWLYASSVVFASAIFLIFGWDWISNLESRGIWWLIISLMLLVSVNWWYWTMRVLRIILKYQTIEYEILKDILADIIKLKVDIRELRFRKLDNHK